MQEFLVNGTNGVGGAQVGKTPDEATARVRELAGALFAAIAHGDEEHRAWLKDAIEAHFAGRPVPEMRGSGRKEARIAELEADLAALHQPRAGETKAQGLVEAVIDADTLAIYERASNLVHANPNKYRDQCRAAGVDEDSITFGHGIALLGIALAPFSAGTPTTASSGGGHDRLN